MPGPAPVCRRGLRLERVSWDSLRLRARCWCGLAPCTVDVVTRAPADRRFQLLLRAVPWASWLVGAGLLVLFSVGLERWFHYPLQLRAVVNPAGPVELNVEVRGVLERSDAGHDADARAPDATETDFAASPSASGAPEGVVPGPVLGAARVRLFAEAEDGTFPLAQSAVTDDSGRARLSGLGGGTYWMLVEADGHARVSRRLTLTGIHEERVLLSSARSLSVTVHDDAEQPIEGATVLVRGGDPLPFGALTTATGVVTFARLGADKVSVQVFARGFEAAERFAVEGDIRVTLRRLGGLGVRVEDGAGAPVGEAEVYVVGSSLWPARRILTDAEGRAELGGLLSGVYDLRARKGGLVSAVESGVALERGQRKDVVLRLAGGRYVQVRVTSEKPASRPISGASVVLAEHGLSPFPLTARTDDGGRASVGPLSPGPAFLSVRAKGFVGRAAIPVPDDTREPLHVVLMKGARLFGEVVDGHGHAIAGARVEVIGIDTDGQPIAETPLMAAYRDAHFDFAMKPLPLIPAGELGVTLGHVPYVNEARAGGAGFAELPPDYSPWMSDVEGRFSAHPVPPGRVRALVRHPAYVEGMSETVTLGPGGEAKVVVVLKEGGRLIGRVVDERGLPVAGVRVVVTANNGGYERSLQSAVDGTFRLASVPREVIVQLARPEAPHRFVHRESVRVEETEEREREFVLPEPRASLEWRVVDVEQRPIELAQLTLTSLSVEVPLRLTQFTRDNGRVLVEDAAGLPLRINVSAPGYIPWSEQLVRAPAEHTIVLQRGLRLTGKVTAVRGRVDVEGARVSLNSGRRRDSTVTNARGEYELDQVPIGEVSLNVEHGDYATQSVRIDVRDTGRSDRPFEVEPIDLVEGARLEGTVVDADGEPVAGARVGIGFVASVLARGALAPGVALTDDAGRFTLRGVAAGEVEVVAISAHGGKGSTQLSVGAGEVLDGLTVELSAPAELEEIDVARGGLAVTFGERDVARGVEVVIVDVGLGSEADRAGLQQDDVLLRVDGQGVRSMRAARSMTNGRPGSDVVIVVRRAGSEQSFRVRREELSR